MTQAQTLQDIYLKIADIYDKFCDFETSSSADISTQLLNEFSINENTWVASTLTFDNPDNKAEITEAQTELNQLLGIALEVAKEERVSTDQVLALGDGSIVPIPKGSPIMLLPELIKMLVLYKAPLKFLLNTIIDFIKDVLLEHIKRKILEKKAEFYGTVEISNSSIIAIPKDAEKMIFRFNNIPSWVGKRFEPNNLNKIIVNPTLPFSIDLARYYGNKLGSVAFGFKLTGQGASDDAYWYDDFVFGYRQSIVDIPLCDNFTNCKRFAYVWLAFPDSCTVGFFRRVQV